METMTLKFIFEHKTEKPKAEEILNKYGPYKLLSYNPNSIQGARSLAYAIVEVDMEVLNKIREDEKIEVELMPNISNTCRRSSCSNKKCC